MTPLILQSFAASRYVIPLTSMWSQHPVLELSLEHTSLRGAKFHTHTHTHTQKLTNLLTYSMEQSPS